MIKATALVTSAGRGINQIGGSDYNAKRQGNFNQNDNDSSRNDSNNITNTNENNSRSNINRRVHKSDGRHW